MKRILIVGADPAVRGLMGTSLLKRGYHVTLAESMLFAYDTALFAKPDLIVTDINLPVSEGIKAIEQIRQTSSLRHIPILITTEFGTGTATYSLQHGANAYEPKPIDPHSFLLTVERLLNESGGVKPA